MKIVIDISDQKYKWIVDNPQTYTDDLCEAIRNGEPLPKHHGRIIDESKINKVFYNTEEVIYNNIKAINTTITHTDAPTIIEGSEDNAT